MIHLITDATVSKQVASLCIRGLIRRSAVYLENIVETVVSHVSKHSTTKFQLHPALFQSEVNSLPIGTPTSSFSVCRTLVKERTSAVFHLCF